MIQTIILGLVPVLVAVIESFAASDRKQLKSHAAKEAERQRIREEESKKLIRIIEANTRLTLGIADAIRTGKCNGNIDGGISAVSEAESAYKQYAVDLLKEKISK